MSFLDQLPPSRPLPTDRSYAARRQLEDIVSGTTRAPRRFGRRFTVSIGIGLALVGGAGAGAAVLLPTKGPVPQTSGRPPAWKQIPDFVAVVSGGRLIGYSPKGYLFPPPDKKVLPASAAPTPIPVYASNLHTLLGHMYPGVGFVRLGQSIASVPCGPVATTSENGTTVTVPCPSVSVTLPDVIGMSTPAAAAKLSALGVQPVVVNQPTRTGPYATIGSMSPAGGSTVPSRSLVTIGNRIPPHGETEAP